MISSKVFRENISSHYLALHGDLAMTSKDKFSGRLSNAFGVTKLAERVTWTEGTVRIFGVQVRPTAAISFAELSALPVEGVVATAFKAAQQDPSDPMSWYKLLICFSYARFGAGRRRGARPKWGEKRSRQLIVDFAAIKNGKQALLDEGVYRLLGKMKEYQTKKGPLSTSVLRKRHKAAIISERNNLVVELKRNTWEDADGSNMIGWTTPTEATSLSREIGVTVVQILIPERDPEHPLPDQRHHLVFYPFARSVTLSSAPPSDVTAPASNFTAGLNPNESGIHSVGIAALRDPARNGCHTTIFADSPPRWTFNVRYPR
jgi:hypothetical protein